MTKPRVAKELLEGLRSEAVEELPPAARLLASFVLANRLTILTSSAAELASRVGVSDATIIRSVQALGFTGLPHLKQVLAATMGAEAAGPATDLDHTLAEAGEGARNALDLALDLQREAMASLDEPEVRQAMLDAISLMHPARRIVIYGIGPTAHMARYMATILQRSGRIALTLDAAGIALADQLLALREGDVVLALTYGRAYREIMATIQEARRLGLPVAMISDSADAMIVAQAKVLIRARRGRTGHVALHATTMAALEAMSLGLAGCDGSSAVGSLVRLNQLRRSVMGPDAS
ncbi:MurR/RpiR family transcriptional regulator [Roseococcus pinisoli]|uniref:MurR/RpiR family transcriptional regulator n=1 Tax=Roseococcus pinisoli TaxID=2835040 RepID=A0ABS5QEU2_9PROT|nr:MurR/RpiR family transcriptional regulator [Roseococcus pinisoli]MBS7812072.1 MurR/RpiR family transcriptional regulator [Roseococcus pinisoli]